MRIVRTMHSFDQDSEEEYVSSKEAEEEQQHCKDSSDQNSQYRSRETEQLFVNYLSDDVGNFDLLAIFEKFGAVSARVMVHHETKESLGFGFVTFPTVKDAVEARNFYQGGKIGDNKVHISFKRRLDDDSHQNILYFRNVAPTINSMDLARECEPFGPLVSCVVHKNHQLMVNYAYVEFENSPDSKECIRALDGKELCGLNLKVRFLQKQDQRNNDHVKNNVVYMKNFPKHFSQEMVENFIKDKMGVFGEIEEINVSKHHHK